MPRARTRRGVKERGYEGHQRGLKVVHPDDMPEEDVEGESGEETRELSKDYVTFANKVASTFGPKEMEMAKHILLNAPKADELYTLLKKEKKPEWQIMRFYKHGINDIALGKGKSISPRAYTGAIAEEMAGYGGFADSLKEMREMEIITPRQYKEAVHKMGRNVKERSREFHSALEELAQREAVVWLFMAIGAILILVSGYTMTGAVVGSVFEVTSLFVIGLVLFIIGLVLKLRK